MLPTITMPVEIKSGRSLRDSDGNLHHFWDTEWVQRLGSDPREVAGTIVARMSDEERRAWSRGKPTDWVMESFDIGRKDAYGLLSESGVRGLYWLNDRNVNAAVRDVRLELSCAGARLAVVLNRALGPAP
jgi:S1/P1 Nuclease